MIHYFVYIYIFWNEGTYVGHTDNNRKNFQMKQMKMMKIEDFSVSEVYKVTFHKLNYILFKCSM